MAKDDVPAEVRTLVERCERETAWRPIDALVYELYGLMEEEIRIVEEEGRR